MQRPRVRTPVEPNFSFYLSNRILGKDRCGANSDCSMVQVDGKWDYECKCKSGHVSYSTKQSENILATLGLNGVGGYREPCEEFKCNYEGEPQNQGHHTNEDSRYKVFVPSNDPNDTENGPLAWEAAKQMVNLTLLRPTQFYQNHPNLPKPTQTGLQRDRNIRKYLVHGIWQFVGSCCDQYARRNAKSC